MLGPRRSVLRKVAIAHDTPTQAELSPPSRALTSWDETHAKRAEITENSTIKVYVTKTIAIDVEEGRVTTKVQQDEDQSRYLSGSKLTFLFLWVYHKPTTQLIDPIHLSEACFSLFFLVRWVPRMSIGSIVHLHKTVALDQNIVATALPVIASYFNSLDSATWIVSAHFLTVSAKRHFKRLLATHAN
jgi:hypothetical protein